MPDLPDAWLTVINAVLDAPVAWRAPGEIASAIGRDSEETGDMLCELDLAGWLAIWHAEPGPLVTLSALAAGRLGARLVEVGPGQVPRWARAGEPDPPAPRAGHVCKAARGAALEFVHDPTPPPDVAAERGERAEARALAASGSPSFRHRPGDLPAPTVLIGLGLTPWPGPRRSDELACPACGGRALVPHAYCLYCDRWGLDRPADPDAAGRASPPRPTPDRVLIDRLEADRLRARRKARRRGRHRGRDAADGPGRTSPVASPTPPPSDFTVPPRAAPTLPHRGVAPRTG